LTNAIKIRRGKETAIFRTERNEDKKALLGAFRQVAESLAEQKRKNIEKEQEKRRSLWQTDMNVSLLSSLRFHSATSLRANGWSTSLVHIAGLHLEHIWHPSHPEPPQQLLLHRPIALSTQSPRLP
jgi:hypothetical protein